MRIKFIYVLDPTFFLLISVPEQTMTSELEPTAVPTEKIDDEINSEQDKQPLAEGASKTEPTATLDEAVKPIEVEEQTDLDKPKRSARKKREPTGTVDQNVDHEMLDTQPLFEQPIIVEGKRSRKPTPRLELSESSPTKSEAPIPLGHGKALGDIPYINYQITHASTDVLSRMRTICYGRRGGKTNVRETLRDFKGFDFNGESDDYQRHLSNLTKLRKDQLRSLSDILGLSAAGRNTEHAERILHFLMEPTDDGKAVPERKASMRSSKSSSVNSKPTDDDGDVAEKMQNGDDDYELFDDEDAEDDEQDDVESDDDYLGSDDEMELTINDDPDDFAYQPGKKSPKRKSPLKRSRSSTRTKRKRVSTSTSKRRARPTKKAVAQIKPTEEATQSAEPASTNQEDDPPTETNQAESIDEPQLTIDTKQTDDGPVEPATVEVVSETR